MSIASRITAMQEHLRDDYSVLTLAGADLTNIDKNIINLKQTWKERLLYFMNSGTDIVWDNWNKVIGEGTSLTLNNTLEAKMKIVLKGNTLQNGTPTPDSPVPIQVVSGDNTIEICGRNLGNPNTLFDEMYNSGYANPPTRTIVDNRNVISFSTYYSHNKPLYVTKYKENTQYTFRVVAKAAESALRYLYIIIDYTDGTKSSASIQNQGTSWDELRIVSTANKTIKDFYFSYSNAGYWYIDEDSFNIIEGDTTDYETYQGASYPVNLPVENLFDENQLLQADGWTYSNGYYNGLVEKYYVAFRYGFNFNTTFEENTQYTIKLNAYTTGGNPRFKIEYTDGTNYMMNFTETTPTDYSYTTTNGKTISKIVGEYGTGGGQTLYLKDIMVQKGSKTNSYTPYGTTPIELCKIGTYQDKIDKSSGKNLISSVTRSGNMLLFNGSTGIDYIFKAGTYTLSFKNPNTTSVYIKTATTSATSLGSGSPRTFTSNEDFNVWIYRSGMTDNETTEIMLNEGTTALPYEPYGNGEWYLEKKIGKVVLDGSESWYASGSQPQNGLKVYHSSTIKGIDLSSSPNLIMCNLLKGITTVQYTNATAQGISSNLASSNLVFNVCLLNTTMTLENWKTLLGNKNMLIYSPLDTPTYTKIEGTLKDQLDALETAMSYNSQTNISQESNDLASILNATALEEME